MENKEYYFCIEDSELDSFLSFCEVNNITFSNGNRFPLGESTFVLRGNEIETAKLSYCSDWDDFIEEYYQDLFKGKSIKDIIYKLKSDGYTFNDDHFAYKFFEIYSDCVLGCCDSLHYDLLEIIFESKQSINLLTSSKSKSYLDFNPLN